MATSKKKPPSTRNKLNKPLFGKADVASAKKANAGAKKKQAAGSLKQGKVNRKKGRSQGSVGIKNG